MSPTSYRTALLRVNMNLLLLPIIPPKVGICQIPLPILYPILEILIQSLLPHPSNPASAAPEGHKRIFHDWDTENAAAHAAPPARYKPHPPLAAAGSMNRAARCSTAAPDAFHISDFNFRPCYMIFFHQRIYSIHNFRKFLLRLRLQPSQIFRLQHIGIQLRGGKQNRILRNRNPLFAAFQSEPIGLAKVIHRFPVIQARIGNLCS